MVEIIPKTISRIPNWLNGLFYFSLVLLLISVISYFILNNSLTKNQDSLASLTEALLVVRSPENLAAEAEILSYQKKINDFSRLKGKHFEPSAVFEIIEENSHPQVWFSQLNLEAKQGKVILGGQTQSFETLGQQLLIFQNAEKIKEVTLSSVSINKLGKIEFSFSLVFGKEIIPNQANE